MNISSPFLRYIRSVSSHGMAGYVHFVLAADNKELAPKMLTINVLRQNFPLWSYVRLELAPLHIGFLLNKIL